MSLRYFRVTLVTYLWLCRLSNSARTARLSMGQALWRTQLFYKFEFMWLLLFFCWGRKRQIQSCGLLFFSALAVACWFDVGVLLLFFLFKSRIHQMWQTDNPVNKDLYSRADQDRGHCCLFRGCTQAQTAKVTLGNNIAMHNCYQRSPSIRAVGGGGGGSSPSSAHVNLSKRNSGEWQKVALRQSKQMY